MIETLYIELTKDCNLQCKHCYQSSPIVSSIGTDTCKDIIKSSCGYNVKDVVFTGGEPLLHKDIVELVKYTKSNGCRVGILSNGTLVNNSIAKDLSSAGLDSIQLSMDGGQVEHEQVRGKGSFKLLNNGIDSLVAHGLSPVIRFMITKLNEHCYLDSIEHCKKHGLQINFGLVSSFGSAVDNVMQISPERYFRITEDLHELKKSYYPRIGIPSFSIESYLNGNPEIFPCTAATKVLVVDTNGRVLPCPFFSAIDFSKHEIDFPVFSGKPLESYLEHPLFRAVTNLKYSKRDCFLRRLQNNGLDPYSLESYIAWSNHVKPIIASQQNRAP